MRQLFVLVLVLVVTLSSWFTRGAHCFATPPSFVTTTSRRTRAPVVATKLSTPDNDNDNDNDNDEADEYDDWYADFDPSEFDDEETSSFSLSSTTSRHDYSRDTTADSSRVDLNAVNSLISQRTQARKTGNFVEADALRDQLLRDHGVRLQDRQRQWRSGCSASGSGSRWGNNSNSSHENNNRSRGGGGDNNRRSSRSFGPHGHDYALSDDAGPHNAGLQPQEIHALLAQRLECKLNRDFDRADEIQQQLHAAGVAVHDGRKEWRADGRGFANNKTGRGAAAQSGDRRRPYEKSPQSLDNEFGSVIQELVEERALAKLDRNYEVADEIRDQLRDEYGVQVDDRLRQWSVGGAFGDDRNSHNKNRRSNFRMAKFSETPDNFDDIQQLVEQRNQARLDRDFETADRILQELADANIQVDDRRREWSVGGAAAASTTTGGSFVQRGGDGNTLSAADETKITQLLQERDACKRDKEYGKADRIRDRLANEFQVRIDDRNKEWHVVTSAYVPSAESAQLDEATQEYVEAQISQRALAKLKRDYETADSIRDELLDDYLISIDDRLKEWTALDAAAGERDAEDDDDDDNGLGDDESDDKGEDNEISLDLNNASDVALNDVVEEVGFGEPQSQESHIEARQEDLASLTVPKLKDRLRERGLPVSGRKAELIDRLLERS